MCGNTVIHNNAGSKMAGISMISKSNLYQPHGRDLEVEAAGTFPLHTMDTTSPPPISPNNLYLRRSSSTLHLSTLNMTPPASAKEFVEPKVYPRNTERQQFTTHEVDYFSAKEVIKPINAPVLEQSRVNPRGIFDFATRVLATPMLEERATQLTPNTLDILASVAEQTIVEPFVPSMTVTTTQSQEPSALNPQSFIVEQKVRSNDEAQQQRSKPKMEAMTREERRRFTNRMASKRYREKKRLEKENGMRLNQAVGTNEREDGHSLVDTESISTENSGRCMKTRRESNRLASYRYRQRQQLVQGDMHHRLDQLNTDIERLEASKSELQKLILQCRAILQSNTHGPDVCSKTTR